MHRFVIARSVIMHRWAVVVVVIVPAVIVVRSVVNIPRPEVVKIKWTIHKSVIHRSVIWRGVKEITVVIVSVITSWVSVRV